MQPSRTARRRADWTSADCSKWDGRQPWIWRQDFRPRTPGTKRTRNKHSLAIILERTRHDALIGEVRAAGARIRLISDGDVSAAIMTCKEESGIDVLFGTGGAPEGVIAAAREVNLNVPLVVRMKGTNEELGRQRLRESGLPIISADNMADAAQKIVAAVAGK